MNNLKLIEKEIKRRKASVRKLEQQPPQVRKYFLIAEKKAELKRLEQTKVELEAWKIVKNKAVDMLIFMLYFDDLQMYNAYIRSLEGECDYERLILTEQEHQTLKKALEVENELV